MKIGGFDTEHAVLLIAEIGNNHEGSLAAAEEMIGRAARAGANAVKFQTIVPAKLVAPGDKERLKQLERLCLKYEHFETLARLAAREGVLFLSTPFDIDSAHFLAPLVPAYKIGSGDNNFFPLLEAVARTKKPIIMSTGLANLDDIRHAKEFIEGVWEKEGATAELALLHCVVSYPTPPAAANLLAMRDLGRLGCTVGYSDHTIGIEAAVLAAALGAEIIEKHFTLDKTRSTFRDHQLSADPEDFTRMVGRIREVRLLLGDGQKVVSEVEKENLPKVRRSIVAGRALPEGTVIRLEDLDWLRPGAGLPPGFEELLIGRKLVKALRKGDAILVGDVTACAA